MAGLRQKVNYFETEEGIDIEKELQGMVDNKLYNTVASYSTNISQYPNNEISFVKKHMHYLNIHPKLDAQTYLANLRLMTRIR